MICAACGEGAELPACAACGADPRLDGRFQLQRALGSGATGTTWLALTEDGEERAIKEMPLRAGDPAKARELLAREVRVLRELDHPQIPRFTESFEVRAGRHRSLCLVMERIRGRTLAEESRERRYSEAEVRGIIEELCGVLAYLHGLSPPVVHRDLKPQNIMRAEDGRLVLIDFGAVRDAVRDSVGGGSTVAGTFGYMAPEQFAGDAVPATDLYAVGALAVALLTRREPRDLVDHSRRLNWKKHVRISHDFEALIDRLLQEAPEQRPSREALSEALRSTPVLPHREPPRTILEEAPPNEPLVAAPRAPASPWPRRLGIALGAAGVFGGLILGVGGVIFGAGTIWLVGGPEKVKPINPPSCEPELHRTQDASTGGHNGWMVVGANADGSRVAVALTQPGGNGHLVVYEAGSREELAYERFSSWNPALVLEPELMDLGIEPQSVPMATWCGAGDTVNVVVAGKVVEADWRLVDEPVGASSITNWELCLSEGRCAKAPDSGGTVWPGDPQVLDTFVLEDHLWVVAEREIPGTNPVMLGGVALR